MSGTKFNTESRNLWIQDQSHRLYPNRVKIIEVLPGGSYKALVEPAIGKKWVEIVLMEEQISDDLIGG